MATSSDQRTGGLQRSPVLVGALVGFLAGIAAGIVLQFGTSVLTIMGGIVSGGSILVGWALHLALSTAFGAFFGWNVELPVFRTLTNTVNGSILYGIVFGVVWYAYIVIGVIIPALVSAFAGESISFLALPGPESRTLLSAVMFSSAYMLYGVLLGWGYAVLEDVQAEPDRQGPDSEAEPADSKAPSDSG
jgi:hypothetical protein